MHAVRCWTMVLLMIPEMLTVLMPLMVLIATHVTMDKAPMIVEHMDGLAVGMLITLWMLVWETVSVILDSGAVSGPIIVLMSCQMAIAAVGMHIVMMLAGLQPKESRQVSRYLI